VRLGRRRKAAKEEDMTSAKSRWIKLFILSGGFLAVSGCAVADAVVQTILAAFQIVDIWV
jgi:hypothetical protein